MSGGGRGGVPWDKVVPVVARLMRRKAIVDRLATALWNQERRDLDDGGQQPAFHCYADGKQEPMPLHKQDADHIRYWRNRARRLLRAIGERP